MHSILITATVALPLVGPAMAAPQAIPPVGSLQRLQVPTAPSGVVSIQADLAGGVETLVLERHSLRSHDFRLLVTRPDGTLAPMPAPAPNTWRGEVAGWADSVVTASLTNEGLTAVVTDHAGQREWQIQPAEGHASGWYSVARTTELDDASGKCGVSGKQRVATIPGGGTRGTGLQLCEIALDSDHEFFLRNASSAQATLDDMERVMNRVDAIYVRDVDVTFQITAAVVRTTAADPYTHSDAAMLLDEFRTHWNVNFQGVRRDVAHLFTGRLLASNTIGIAYTGTVCNMFDGYGLSESRFTNAIVSRTGLTAHEIGHNFNAFHCDNNGDCRIMCMDLGGCMNDLTRFGVPSANTIRNFAQSRSCLLDLADPLTIPIFDTFPTTALDRDVWISSQATEINTAGLGEPSAPYSVRLNARNADPHLDDWMISNDILLGAESGIELSFWAQHRGVPAGGTLTFEIVDANDNWIQLVELVSDGIDETVFTQYSVLLPAGAYHDQAQLRIRAGVDGLTENWYLDDVRIDRACGVTNQYCFGAPNSVTFLGADLDLVGSASILANDLDLVISDCPPNSFGIHLMGDQPASSPLADGFLCVGGAQIFRLTVLQNDALGASTFSLDQTNLPPGAAIQPGDLVHFQLWYRDTSPNGANLSSAVSIVFCP